MVKPICRSAILATAMIGLVVTPVASAFTQSGMSIDVVGSGVPMGHEWLTRMSAIELLNGDATPDPADPRRNWGRGLAKNLDLGPFGQKEVERIIDLSFVDVRYQSLYKPVYWSIIGERWVDIGGFNVTKSKATELLNGLNCWDAVAQEPADVQQDHFMRRYDDIGGQGGVAAASRAQQRFIDHFVAAAMVLPGSLELWDGGGYARPDQVDRNYFLFGRAVHLFQDSFSSEHTVRIAEDSYERVRQVKSYLCAKGSEQHEHSDTAVLNYTSGDVIWRPGTRIDAGWAGYKPSNMKPLALVSVEAGKDLWAAFIRTMGTPIASRRATAEREAEELVKNWLQYDAHEMTHWYDEQAHRVEGYVYNDGESGRGQTQAQCMKGLEVNSGKQRDMVVKLEHDRRLCLFNIEPVAKASNLNDPYLHMPFLWKWKSELITYDPPPDWRIPTLQGPTQIMHGQECGNIEIRAPDDYPKGYSWKTCTGYELAFQEDGNLVVYNPHGKHLWESKTYGTDAGTLRMQSDGNLVLYGNRNNHIWATNTDKHPGAFLSIQDDGNVVVYDNSGKRLWDTETNDK